MTDGTPSTPVTVTRAGSSRYSTKSGQATIPARVRDLLGYDKDEGVEFEVYADAAGRQVIFVEVVEDAEFDTDVLNRRREANARRRR